ncbi:MAG: NAD(P)/FAD-dependent oxidoreductase [Thaumarchaeota archaeon]|nr:NAD(P)/FAD-dependent oxidoreductase [Nitrososphaerota archaeon]
MADFDAIVIGAGHNGLGLACYLAKSGLKVLVCEAQSKVGGFLHTEEVILGYRHSMHAITMGTYPPIYRDFDLAQYGTRLIRPEVQFGMILDKKALVVHNGQPKTTFKSVAKFSLRDAKRMEQLHRRFHATWIREYYSPPMPSRERGQGLNSEDRREWQRICSMSPREVIEEFFESEMVKLFLCARSLEEGSEGYSAVSRTKVDVFRGAGDYVFKILTDPEYCIPEGGSRRLAEGLARIVEAHGGTILKNSPVSKIIVKDGRAAGIKLVNGTIHEAKKLVACNVDIKTMLELVGEENLDANSVAKIRSVIPPDSGKFDLHIASNEPPQYTNIDDQAVNRALNVFVGYESLADVDRHAAESAAGKFPEKPSFHGGCQTLYDKTLAPPGKHTLWEWLFTSPRISTTMTPSNVEEYKERVLSRWQQYAPNLKTAMTETYHYATRKGGLTGGTPSIGYGQYYDNRPIPELSGYRTPIQGLYLAHSACHPASTVRYGPAYNAMTIIARDLGIKKWWSSPALGQPYAME